MRELHRLSVSSKYVMKTWLTRSPKLYRSTRRFYLVARYVLRQPHDSDYRVFGLFRDRRGPFLDVGANAGMSALSFRLYNKHSPIVSVEPNPYHERDLHLVAHIARRFRYEMIGAGATDGAMDLYIPVYRGVPITAIASLSRPAVLSNGILRTMLSDRMDGPDFAVVGCRVEIRRLDFLDMCPDFVKIDVEGGEYEALVGLTQTLTRSSPVLLIEHPDARVRSFLAERGYSAWAYSARTNSLVDEDPESANTVFLPAEEAAAWSSSKAEGAA